MDFLMVTTRNTKKGIVEIYPKFIIKKSNDLMIRGGDFYAIWLEEKGLWSTDEQDALQVIDNALDIYKEENASKFGDCQVKVLHMWDSESGMIDHWHKYCQKQMRDNFHMLDEQLIFSNTNVKKRDYASKKLAYPLESGPIDAYDKLMSTLYSEEERHKIEWAIGAVVSGDSKKIQKFLVLYGAAGTGKSTVLNIIQKLFEGYYSVFDAKSLGSSNNSFALEAFKTNPLVAIQHDGDLSRIEDNTRLNSLVSHELMTVNEKFKSTYANRFKAFLFMGTNKPVKITDGKSGLIRRLIDVTPSGNKVGISEYRKIMTQIDFELGSIAQHCLDVYLADPNFYDDYIPVNMLGASNDFYNFVEDSFMVFKQEDGVSLKQAWEMYKTYNSEANVSYPFSQRIFKEELKNYFKEFEDRHIMDDGTRIRSYYAGFKTDIFEKSDKKTKKSKPKTHLIEFKEQESIFDKECIDCLAQYASSAGTPQKKWEQVRTHLSDLDTSKLHYVRVPENHIVIDFDICDESGNKSFEANLEAASKWPATYAELSKSGSGIHLHYIYTGDVKKLKRLYAPSIEVKVFTGNSALRRLLSKCNNLPIAKISSGLPIKEEKVVNSNTIKSEKGLRALIIRNLNKEIHPGTKPSVDFIYQILEDCYKSDLKYDLSDMKGAVYTFAQNSSNHAEYCMKLVNQMKFKSKNSEEADEENYEDEKIVFYDIEVFPNLLLVNWKIKGEGASIVRMINPKPTEIEQLIKRKLVGFNCRRYDNHILYARLMGYDNQQIYNLSQKIVSGDKHCFFGEAYNISYTDIYDFSTKKQSLKKWEIELGIHHQELGLPWDQPVPEEKWVQVAEYCDNDVIATEALWNHKPIQTDFLARQMLADIAGMTVNDTTNSLTTRIIFGDDRKPQKQFNYRNMGEVPTDRAVYSYNTKTKKVEDFHFSDENEDFTIFTENDDGVGLPIFPGYVFDKGISTYRGEEIGEGGYVYAEPGIYGNVALLDIASMHPHSIIAENLFGEYTKNFKDLVDARIFIKHKEYDKARKMLGGKLAPYLKDESSAKALSTALKIPINSVYGLTSANFDNPFRDTRNKDNIVAKRGALFMVNLKHEVQKRGFVVAHIKTDSIKIPDATPKIIQFVMDYGKMYGYTFEHEATYDRMSLVNDAVYIARYKDDKKKNNLGDWTATGTQFQVPYVFKSLFTREPIKFEDLCETKSVKSALYLDMNEDLPDVSAYEKELKDLETKYKKGLISDIIFEKESADLVNKIAEGHYYKFVGKVGQFCPIVPGGGGGELVRDQNGKFYAVTGTKGYRWMESEMVKNLGKEDLIDRSYYDNLANEAINTIYEFGDYDWFVSDDPYIPPKIVKGRPEYTIDVPGYGNDPF